MRQSFCWVFTFWFLHLISGVVRCTEHRDFFLFYSLGLCGVRNTERGRALVSMRVKEAERVSAGLDLSVLWGDQKGTALTWLVLVIPGGEHTGPGADETSSLQACSAGPQKPSGVNKWSTLVWRWVCGPPPPAYRECTAGVVILGVRILIAAQSSMRVSLAHAPQSIPHHTRFNLTFPFSLL